MRFYHLSELVSERRLRLGYYRSEKKMTNLLINGILIEVFKRLKKEMSMKDFEHKIKVVY